jgi:phosphoribosylformimino-5-aminoimidazole carboxamide ribotide isomerase
MLIPSIDLQDGRVVQLEQGERLRYATSDVDAWIERFRGFPLVQVIDLDAALGRGRNTSLVERICEALPCQVGGGIRSPADARAALEAGARRVIAGSCLFGPGGVDLAQAAALSSSAGLDRLVAAIDSRGGRVVVRGWTEATAVTPADAIRALEPYVAAFLYTHVDTEGLMTGLDTSIVQPLRALTSRQLIVAGGIRRREEVDVLHAAGLDAVVGMAIYSGLWDEREWRRGGA